MLYHAIKNIYPSILDSQFTLQDDGSGPYIKTWNYAQPKPTLAQIEAASLEAVGKTAVPSRISMAQACLALYQSDLLGDVEVLIAAQGKAAQIEWHRRQTVERSHPLVQLAKTELQLTEKQLDDLFTLGASL